ncbi:MAG: hypothetical protein WED00_16045 [Aquisalimonadaceae bacterium]
MNSGVLFASGLVLALVLTACQSARYAGDESSPYYRVPDGSRVILLRDLTVPANNNSVYLQDGRLTPYSTVNRHEAYCRLRLNTTDGAPRTIRAGTFDVTRVTQEEPHSAALSAPLQASAGTNLAGMFGDGSFGGGPSRILSAYTMHLHLHSTTQADVSRLSCSQWVYFPPHSVHVSIAQIRGAVDGIMTLQVSSP